MKNNIMILLIITMTCLSCEKNLNEPSTYNFEIEEISSVEAYQDIRWKDLSKIETQLDSTMIITLTFNNKTIWPEKYRNYANEIMNKGKNPGLGIKQLHDQGITGSGIYAAIIDQNLCLDYHPEFKNKIIKYKDFGCNQPANKGSMHGPAVISLFVGNTIGVAPDVKLYYAAAPSWTKDAKYYADALNWIIEENLKLASNNKIRVVSVSAAPSGEHNSTFKNKNLWDEACDKATENNILVIDCTTHHVTAATCYFDIFAPEDVTRCIPGFPGISIPYSINRYEKFICIPASFRAQSEEYSNGEYSYQYTGRGGLSWSIPYMAGVLCLGWQINPELTNDQIIEYLYETAYIYEESFKIIYPAAFIEKVVNKQFHHTENKLSNVSSIYRN
jgi:serine protease AprX